jgi:glycosyltransferase involved in cell wall biosynthesis
MNTNILIIEYGSGFGGSSAYLYSFLHYIDRSRFNPIVVFYDYAEGPYVAKISELGFKIVFLRNCRKRKQNGNNFSKPAAYVSYVSTFLFRDMPAVLKLIGIIVVNKIRLVLLNQEVIAHVPALFASALAMVPCVARKAGVGAYEGKKMRKLLSFFPDVFIASSDAEYNYHLKSKFPYKKMVTVYEGVDVSRFIPRKNGKLPLMRFGITSDKKVAGYVSRFEEGKGHFDFIKAAELVTKRIPEAVFLIVGDEVGGNGNIRRFLKKEVKTMGIEKNVVFAGWQDDVSSILQAIDVFVHCPDSWREGLGIAALEALASGKPMVVTDNWGLAETTVDDYNGFVVPIGDHKKMAEIIALLLENKPLRDQMGINSRVRAEELFDIRKNVNRIEDIITETLINAGKENYYGYQNCN